MAVTVTMSPEAFAVSHPDPLSNVAIAPMVVPLGTPPICTDWLGGAVAPAACVNVRLGTLVVAVEAKTLRVTGIVCDGAPAVDTRMEPV